MPHLDAPLLATNDSFSSSDRSSRLSDSLPAKRARSLGTSLRAAASSFFDAHEKDLYSMASSNRESAQRPAASGRAFQRSASAVVGSPLALFAGEWRFFAVVGFSPLIILERQSIRSKDGLTAAESGPLKSAAA